MTSAEGDSCQEPFGRQPQPVRVDFFGDMRDVDHYMRMFAAWVEHTTYDVTTRMGNQLMIHPRAIND